MPLQKKIIIDDTAILMWIMDEDSNALFNLCSDHNIDIRDDFSSFCEKRKCEKLAVHLLLFSEFKNEYKLCHSSAGKPYLQDSNARISISHSGNIAIVALNYKQDIGIDIEMISPKVLRVREKFLNEQEKLAVSTNDITKHLLAWTAKEAMFKIMPESKIDFTQHLHLALPDNDNNSHGSQSSWTYHGFESRSPFKRKYNINSFTHSNYIITLLTETK